MSSMGGGDDNKAQKGPFAHDAKEQAAIDYVIANFDSLAVLPDTGRTDFNAAFVKAGTKLLVDGEEVRLQLNVYRFNNPDGTPRYAVDIKKLLGAGGNATVNMWVDAETGEALAAKIIKDPSALNDALKEASRFNALYEKLHSGKYQGVGKIFFAGNPKKQTYEDGEDDRKWPDNLIFVMPMFPGATVDKIDEKKIDHADAKTQLPSLTKPIAKKQGLAPRVGWTGDDDLFLTDDLPLHTLFGYQQEKTVEQEFEARQAEVREEIKSGRLDFPGDMRRVDIPEHIEKFRTQLITKEQLDKEVKNNLERFIMRPSEVIPAEMTQRININTDFDGRPLQKIDQLDFEENFEFLLLVFKNMIHAVSVAHEIGMFVNDVKLENFLFDDEGNVYLIDLGEAVDKDDTDPSIAKEFVLRGTVPYATPENLLALMNNRLHYPEAEKARKLLALKALYKEKGLEVPKELQDLDQNELEKTAKAWTYTYNAESDAYALGCCGEMMCGLLIPATVATYIPTAGFGMPASIFTTADDPRAAKINQFLKITKGLRGQGEPQISLEQAATSIDAIRNKPVAVSEEIIASKETLQEPPAEKRKKSLVPNEVASKKTVTFDDDIIVHIPEENNDATEHPAPDTKENDVEDVEKKVIESVTPPEPTTLKRRRSGIFPHFIKKPATGLPPSVVRDIKECFKKIDKSSGVKNTFVAAGTKSEPDAKEIPYDCYRLPNGVIVAKTNTTLGAGANGTVYQGIDIKSGALYAIKIPKIDDKDDEDDKENNVSDENNEADRKDADRKENIEWSNKKIKLGNKLMASADIEKNPQHSGMYHTMNLDGLEIAFMPKLAGEQLAELIKTHVDPLLEAQLDANKQKMAPAVEPLKRRPSQSSFIISEEEIRNTAVNNAMGDLKVKVQKILYPIAYYKEKRRNESDRLLRGHISKIKTYLKSGKFLSIDMGEDAKERVTIIEDKVKSYLPDSIISTAINEYSKHREEKVVIDDPEVFIKKLLLIVRDCADACKDNANLLRQGATNRDIKPENMIRTQLGLTTIDYDEAEEFKVASDVIFGKDHIAKGSPYYLSPYNKEVYYHLESDAASINAASEAIAIYEILVQQNMLTEDLTEPGGMFSDENLSLLRILADPPDYVWNAQSEANAIGISAEELSQTCFKQLLLKKREGGMPNRLISETDDPCVVAFNKFLEITKKLITPNVANTYVASQAAEDFEILEQRIEALQDVRQQLKHPESIQPSSITGRIASKVQPYLPIGATVKTATDMTRQSPAWDNVIQTLAVDLDPTKHKIEVKADKSVAIKSKTTKKSIGSLALSEGNVHGTTSDSEAFEQMLKVYIASHKPDETVNIQIVGLADDPRQALKFAYIANSLGVVFSFDTETRQAVDKYAPNNQIGLKL